jgi:hypothetical protein
MLTMRVKSINYTGFLKKKQIIHVNSATVEHSSTVQWFLPHEKQQNDASTKPAAQLNF